MIDPGVVGELAEALPGVRRKGTAARPAWYVRDRLLVRFVDAATLRVRVPLGEREALLDRHPGAFGVPPRLEAHDMVEAYPARASPEALRDALALAWRHQTG